jgi:hypothetical protein
MRKEKSAKRPKKNFLPFFFSLCYNFCLGSRILLKFCMSNLGVVFNIWCKRLDLFWSVSGLISKIPTYPTCQLAPLSPSRRVTAPDGSGERRIPAAATKTSNRLDNTKCSCLLFGLGERVDQSRRTTTLGAIRAEEVGAPVHFSCARPDYIGHGGDM